MFDVTPDIRTGTDRHAAVMSCLAYALDGRSKAAKVPLARWRHNRPQYRRDRANVASAVNAWLEEYRKRQAEIDKCLSLGGAIEPDMLIGWLVEPGAIRRWRSLGDLDRTEAAIKTMAALRETGIAAILEARPAREAA